jgi:cobalamin biosynthesis Co2+ chelatase CbiK
MDAEKKGYTQYFVGLREENGKLVEVYLTREEAKIKDAEMLAIMFDACDHADDMYDPEKSPEAIGMYW